MSKLKQGGRKVKIYNPLNPVQQKFTPEQAQEFRRCASDFEYFSRSYIKVQDTDLGPVLFEPRTYQSRMAKISIENRFSIFVAPRQALSIEEMIPTPTGFTKMGDLKIGDYVLDADGHPTQVIDATDIMESNECYVVKFSTGESIIADAAHLWNVQYEDSRAGRPQKILTTKELAREKLTGDKNFKWYSVKTTKALQLKEQHLPIEPYLLGVWLGDGCSNGGKFTTHPSDLEHYKREFKIAGHDILSVRDGGNHNLMVTLTGLTKQLRLAGLQNNKHIPVEYLRASYAQRLALLQGLMDTDGYCGLIGSAGNCIYPNAGGTCEISSSYPRLAGDIIELIASLGLKVSVKPHRTRASKTSEYKDSQRITFTSYSSEIPVFRMERKLSRMKLAPHHTRKYSTKKRGIVSIMPTESVPVRCISVANKEQLFLVGRTFIPTHNCGKSVTIGAILLWYAIFNKNYRIGIGSNKLKSAKVIMQNVKFAYEELPTWMKPFVKEYNVQSVLFDNGSSIEASATTGDGMRSKTFNILYLDEFAHLKNNKIAEDFWSSTFPVVASGKTTKVIITSTPNGTEGVYAQLWFGAIAGDNGFAHSKIESHEVPGRDETYKQAMLKKMTLTKYLQEFEGAFLSSKGTLIHSMILESLSTKDPITVVGDTSYYLDPAKRRLAVAADVGAGIGEDFHAVQIFDIDTLEQVGEYRNNSRNLSQFTKDFVKIMEYLDGKLCKQLHYSIENNSYGLGVWNLLDNSSFKILEKKYVMPVHQYGQKLPGICTTGKSKRLGCAKFKDLVEERAMKLNSKRLVSELKFFVKSGESFKAETGMTDDLVMGCVTLCNMLMEMSSSDDSLDTKLNTIQRTTDDMDNSNGGDEDSYMPMVI